MNTGDKKAIEIGQHASKLCDMAATIAAGHVTRDRHHGVDLCAVGAAVEDAFNIYNRIAVRLVRAASNKDSPHMLTCAFRADERQDCDCVYYFDQQDDK